MDEIARLLVMIVLAGVGLTLLGGAAVWYSEESRRIRRGLKHVLGGKPEAMLVAAGRGRGAGFSFPSGRLAVAWDAGTWCLVYRLEEVVGAELIVDGQVAGRVYRGEPRRAVDLFGGAEKLVRLRLIFDDPAHPDFDLDLWVAGDEARRKSATASEAMQEANRWLARTESILKRQAPEGRAGPLPISNAALATEAVRERALEAPPRKPRAFPKKPEPQVATPAMAGAGQLPFDFEPEPDLGPEPAHLDLDPELEREPLSTLGAAPSPAAPSPSAKPPARTQRDDEDDEPDDGPPW
ncbi:hypothetical protein [Phenylobacterium deserti]|uniref:Uncharacterized protein n=1 Tax=Phenylobacterium deserti TaxID=1914756 RepID=A0A328ACA1_9CAUL|nr:hypothetical protein [Phenylobacterium deserti]RAK52372.1 hypothetical protein DJ018_14675 [Phenylobacterium deserti]